MLGMFINKMQQKYMKQKDVFAKAHLEGEGQSLQFTLLFYPLHSTISCTTFEFALYHNIVLDQMKKQTYIFTAHIQ